MDHNFQTNAIDPVAAALRLAARPLSQDEILARVLAAVLNAHPGKCAVLQERHLPLDLSDFTNTVS